jgi:hypothetical protein
MMAMTNLTRFRAARNHKRIIVMDIHIGDG